MNKKISLIVIGSFVVVTTLLAIRLITQSQDTRRSAYFSEGRMYLVPESGITAQVGGDIVAQVWVNPGNAKVDAVRSFICYDDSLLSISNAENAVFNVNSAFDTTLPKVVDHSGKKCLDVTLLSVNSSNEHIKNAAFNAFNVRLKALKAGNDRLEIIGDKVEVSGANPGSLDKAVSMSNTSGAGYKIVAANKFKQVGCAKSNNKYTCVPDSYGNYDTQEACETSAVCNPVIDCSARCSKNYGCTWVNAFKAITDCDHPIEASVVRAVNNTDCSKIDSLPVGGNNDNCTVATANGSLFFRRENYDSTVVNDVGVEFGQDVFMNTNGKKINSAKVTMCYGDNLSPQFYKFWLDPKFSRFDYKRDIGNNCLEFSIKSDLAESELPVGNDVRLGIIYFVGNRAGSGNISFDPTRSSASGPNANFNLTAPKTQPYIISNPISDGSGVNFTYRVTYKGVTKDNSKCAMGWPIQIVVKDNFGVTKTFSNVPMKNGDVVGRLAVYKNIMKIDGFSSYKNLAFFIKGQKHSQVKFGENKQTTFYNKAGGEIVIEPGLNTFLDFASYSLSPGDIAKGDGVEGQDGVIDGRDYSYIKNRAMVHESVGEGGYLAADLDGNCIVNALDADLLRQSLIEKQDQLY